MMQEESREQIVVEDAKNNNEVERSSAQVREEDPKIIKVHDDNKL